MLIDANVLLYSVDESSPFHRTCRDWMTRTLNGPQRVGIPWQSLWAFLRIVTNPRVLAMPLLPAEAWEHVQDWLDAPTVWVPTPGRGHAEIMRALVVGKDIRAAMVADAVLSAICVEHGLAIVSADSDFARFPEVRWINPLIDSSGSS